MRYLQKIDKTPKIELDVKDKKILSLIAENSRTPLTQIAKKVGLSRDSINYRIKNYEKKGLIQGYITFVDISKFGYQNYHMFIKLNNPSKDVEKEIVSRLIKLPFVRALLKYSGNYDFEIGLIAKNFKELDSFIEKISNDLSDFLQEYELLLIVDTFIAKTFPRGFFDKIEKSEYLKKENNDNKKIKLDKKDFEILKIISENSVAELVDISSKTKLSVDSISYRMKKMRNDGVIKSYIPILNYTSLNYSLYGLLLNINPLDEKNKKVLTNFLLANKNVLWAVKTIGKFNTLIYFLVKDIEEFQNTIINLRSLFPKQINNYETLVAYEEYKYVYFPRDLF